MPASTMDRLAGLISHVFSPAVLVTLLLLLAPLRFPQICWIHALIATLFTTLIPWLALGWARIGGRITDLHVTRREQRWPLLLISLLSLLAGLGLLVTLKSDLILIREVLLVLAGLLITGGITLVWKISIHMAVGAFVFLHGTEYFAVGPQLAVVMVALIGWSRIRLVHHTSSQVFAGTSVGAVVSLLGLLPILG